MSLKRYVGTPQAQYRLSIPGCRRKGRFRPNAPLLPESAPQGKVDASALFAHGPLLLPDALWGFLGRPAPARDPGRVCAGVVALFTSAGGHPAPFAQDQTISANSQSVPLLVLFLFMLREVLAFRFNRCFIASRVQVNLRAFPYYVFLGCQSFIFQDRTDSRDVSCSESRSLALLFWARKMRCEEQGKNFVKSARVRTFINPPKRCIQRLKDRHHFLIQ